MHRMAALRELESTLSKDTPNITRFPRSSSSRISQPATEQGLKDSGEEALALANALSRRIAENEARACNLVQRAVNDLEVAKLEIEELEARAARAEKRAEKAESYLLRVEDALGRLFERRGGWPGSELNLRRPSVHCS